MPTKPKFTGSVPMIITGTYVAGTYQATTVIPVNISTVMFIADRNSWPNTGADVITVTIDVSTDGGQNWTFYAGFTSAGGDIINDRGQTLSQTFGEFTIPQSLWGATARVTCNLAVTLNTQISVLVQ